MRLLTVCIDTNIVQITVHTMMNVIQREPLNGLAKSFLTPIPIWSMTSLRARYTKLAGITYCMIAPAKAPEIHDCSLGHPIANFRASAYMVRLIEIQR